MEKITLKVVQIKLLAIAMHITNQKSCAIITVGHLLNIFMAHDLCLIL